MNGLIFPHIHNLNHSQFLKCFSVILVLFPQRNTYCGGILKLLRENINKTSSYIVSSGAVCKSMVSCRVNLNLHLGCLKGRVGCSNGLTPLYFFVNLQGFWKIPKGLFFLMAI